MEYKKLGSTDLSISRLGFGCWAIGGHGYGKVDDHDSRRAIQKALELGINFFDTADVYGFGHSEEILSSALGTKRYDVIIATKFGVSWDNSGKTFKDCSPNKIYSALDASLKRLKLDCISLYQLHWHDGKTPMEDILEALQRCKEKGKIRYAGCSNIPSGFICKAKNTLRLESLQLPYNLIQRDAYRDIQYCSSNLSMGILVYGVLVRGLFSGKYSPDSKFQADDTRGKDPNFSGSRFIDNLRLVKLLDEIGRIYHKTVSQVAIRWVLDNPSVTSALIGVKTDQQVVENIKAIGWSLNADHWNYLARAGNQL